MLSNYSIFNGCLVFHHIDVKSLTADHSHTRNVFLIMNLCETLQYMYFGRSHNICVRQFSSYENTGS